MNANKAGLRLGTNYPKTKTWSRKARLELPLKLLLAASFDGGRVQPIRSSPPVKRKSINCAHLIFPT